ncbi:hypothetical protein, partial [Hyphomonas sp.]|uniref:hypothetical protein n=1 Tax=Hyphomonas sp. TaxID=87 RepID=UPI00329A2E97
MEILIDLCPYNDHDPEDTQHKTSDRRFTTIDTYRYNDQTQSTERGSVYMDDRGDVTETSL